MASKSGTLYTGVTSNLWERVMTHKLMREDGFTKKYRITRLVYYEETEQIELALEREKEIKGWRRSKKIRLIESLNHRWEDLAEGWYQDGELEH
jgi:putative endonuclease